MRFRKNIGLLTLTLLAALLGGCTSGAAGAPEGNIPPPESAPSPPESAPVAEEDGRPAEAGPSARVIVTRDFGKSAIVAESVAINEDTTALEALKMVANVETRYGGGFVNSIEGISSQYQGSNKTMADWFFYVNGVSLSTGAGGYILQDGDSEHWEYHNWSFRQYVPALIGDFPEPFLHGVRGKVYPTTVAYQNGFEAEARQIAGRLGELGVENVTARSFSEVSASDRETSNLILLGTSDFEPVKEMNEHWDRLGFFSHFEGGALKVFDAAGGPAGDYNEGTGLIQATQSIWNPRGVGAGENVVWMVSGIGESGVRAAVDVLVNHPDDIQYACAVVVTEGETLKVP